LAVLVSSIFFGAVHTFGFTHAVMASLLGVALAVLYQWRGTLVAPAFAHGGFNLLQVAALVLLQLVLANAPVLGVGGVDDQAGVRVQLVVPGSGAEAAGVVPGDVITHLDGTRLHSFRGLRLQLAQHRAGDRVRLRILRAGKTIELEAELQAARSR
jgi:S1-C subfamily serine protease